MTPDRPTFVLSAKDRQEPLWMKLMAHFDERLRRLHIALEQDKPEAETAKLRGEIKAYRNLLKLNERQDTNSPPP